MWVKTLQSVEAVLQTFWAISLQSLLMLKEILHFESNNNVRILINGKPSGLVGISGPDGLRQLPSESIEKVKVITSPSARYDAEGTGGILNIILKKQERSGFNGNFNVNGGVPKHTATATVNWKTNKLNVFSTNTIGRRTSISNGLSENEYFNGEEANSYLFETGKTNRERDQKFISLERNILLMILVALPLMDFTEIMRVLMMVLLPLMN